MHEAATSLIDSRATHGVCSGDAGSQSAPLGAGASEDSSGYQGCLTLTGDANFVGRHFRALSEYYRRRVSTPRALNTSMLGIAEISERVVGVDVGSEIESWKAWYQNDMCTRGGVCYEVSMPPWMLSHIDEMWGCGKWVRRGRARSGGETKKLFGEGVARRGHLGYTRNSILMAGAICGMLVSGRSVKLPICAGGLDVGIRVGWPKVRMTLTWHEALMLREWMKEICLSDARDALCAACCVGLGVPGALVGAYSEPDRMTWVPDGREMLALGLLSGEMPRDYWVPHGQSVYTEWMDRAEDMWRAGGVGCDGGGWCSRTVVTTWAESTTRLLRTVRAAGGTMSSLRCSRHAAYLLSRFAIARWTAEREIRVNHKRCLANLTWTPYTGRVRSDLMFLAREESGE